MADAGGGGTIAIDPQAVDDSIIRLTTMAHDTRQIAGRCADHQARAQDALAGLRGVQHQLERLVREDVWRDVGFADLEAALAYTAGQLGDMLWRANQILQHLAETHPGRLAGKFEREFAPLTGRLSGLRGQADGASQDAGIQRFLETLWNDGLLAALDLLALGALGATEDVDALLNVQKWVLQHEEDLLNYAGDNFDHLWDLRDAMHFFQSLKKDKGLKGFEPEAPGVGGFIFDVGWSVASQGNLSMHTIGSAVAGQAIQDSLYLTPAGPYILAAQGALAITSIVATGCSAGFSIAAARTGGEWGAADASTARSWGDVADDADSANNIFNDLGSIAVDAFAGGAALNTGSPQAFAAEQHMGVGPSKLGSDFGNLGHDVLAIPKLAIDLEASEVKSEVVVGSQAAISTLNSLPLPHGVTSHVDSFLTSTVAHFIAEH